VIQSSLRADDLARALLAKRSIPCLCEQHRTIEEDVDKVSDRSGLTVTQLACRLCRRRWTRIG
jgi:hypothetical protein